MDEKKIQLTITDATGHSTFELTVKEAADKIIEQVKNFAKFVYIDDKPYTAFENNFSSAEIDQLNNALLESDEVLLTGALVGGQARDCYGRFLPDEGGGVKVCGTVSKQQMSKLLTGKKKPQIAVCFTRSGGRDKVNVLFSNYNGAIAKMTKYSGTVVAAVIKGFEAAQDD